MKRILYAVMLLLGLSVMASCEKEGTEVDKGKLEGKWWVAEKFEARFNGEIVKTFNTLQEAEWDVDRIIFENGNATTDTRGSKSTFSYSLYGKDLTIEGITLNIIKLNNKELVGDMLEGKGSFIQWHLDDIVLSEGKVISKYKGKDIYSPNGSTFWTPYWYYDNNNKAVLCEHNGDLDDSNLFWYDTERYYFRAE